MLSDMTQFEDITPKEDGNGGADILIDKLNGQPKEKIGYLKEAPVERRCL